MVISIIGTGKVGSVLGKRLAEKGHEIIFGSRNNSGTKVRNIIQEIGKGVQVESISRAMHMSSLIILAVPWESIKGIIDQGGNLTNKIYSGLYE